MTLIEILVSISIIAVLAAALIPAIGVVRGRVRVTQAQERLAEIHMALQHYAAEERRHRYPPQTSAGDLSLRLDPSDAVPGNLNLLRQGGYEIDTGGLSAEGSAPFALLDPWHRPYQYRPDNDLLASSGAQRPMPPAVCPGWNTAGSRPWGYVWSTAKDGRADGAGWLYVKDAP